LRIKLSNLAPFLLVLCALLVLFFLPVRGDNSFVRAAEWLLMIFGLILLCRKALAWQPSPNAMRLMKGRMFTWQWILIAIGIGGPLIYGLLTIVFDVESRRNPIVIEAEKVMERSEDAKNDLGQPIEIGWPIDEQLEVNGNSGNALFFIPVHGSRGKGKMYVAGSKADDIWRVDKIYLTVEGSRFQRDLMKGKSEVIDKP
jgi:hypothetical protein